MLWLVVLFEVCTDERNEFQFNLYMSRAKGADEGGSGSGMCKLRM